MRHGHNKNSERKSLSPCPVLDSQKHLLTDEWHPGFVEDYVHQGDLMRDPLRLICYVHCYALMAGLDVMNK